MYECARRVNCSSIETIGERREEKKRKEKEGWTKLDDNVNRIANVNGKSGICFPDVSRILFH